MRFFDRNKLKLLIRLRLSNLQLQMMNKLLFSAAMFAAITTAQENDDDDKFMNGDIATTADFEGDMHSFDFFGDCIGLSPVIFGKEG